MLSNFLKIRVLGQPGLKQYPECIEAWTSQYSKFLKLKKLCSIFFKLKKETFPNRLINYLVKLNFG